MRIRLNMLVGWAVLCCVTACNTTTKRPQSGVSEVAAEKARAMQRCVANAEACQTACHALRMSFYVLEAPKVCVQASERPLACYCSGEVIDTLPEEPPLDSHQFAGCRFSISACLESCSNLQGFAVEHPQRCPIQAGKGPIACFCPKA